MVGGDFFKSMNGKKPKSEIIDSEKAMANEIKNVMSDCVHRLCCWHLARNA